MEAHATVAWWRRLALAALIVGLAFRLFPVVLDPDAPLYTCDGRANWNMAQNLAAGRGLTIDDPVVYEQYCRLSPGPSHHYSPLLPIVEAAFILVLGPNLFALATTMVLLSFGAVATVYWTTRNLFGADAGLTVAGLMALDWTGVFYGTRQGYSENLVLITLVFTLWGILKSLADERFILFAGLFAGLGYLSKASAGWFFLIAGLGGLSWRLLHRGWRVLLDRNYVLAIGIFGSIFALWSARNLYHFWDGTPAGFLSQWQTSPTTAANISHALGQPTLFAKALFGKLPILLFGVFAPILGLYGPLGKGVREWKREDVSGLWLASALLFVLGWLFAATFWVVEGTRLAWADPVRYVAPATLPLVWLIILTQPDWRNHRGWAIAYAVSLVLTAVMPWLVYPGRIFGQF